MTGFEKRPLGRTALEVTPFGLRCATLGGSRVPVTRGEAEAIVRAAWAAGVRYVDTAPFYGFGQAERCVGDALREVPRDEWVLSTKVGRLLRPHANPTATELRQSRMPFHAVFDYSYDAIMRSCVDGPALQEVMLRMVKGSLAVMCSACWCSPGGLLALMGSAHRGLIIRTGSLSR